MREGVTERAPACATSKLRDYGKALCYVSKFKFPNCNHKIRKIKPFAADPMDCFTNKIILALEPRERHLELPKIKINTLP